MARTLSTAAVRALNAQETGEVFLILLRIISTQLPATLYFVRNTENIVSNGNTYIAYGFDIALPDENPDSLPTIQLTIDNVDKQIVESLRLLTEPPTIELEVILASQPNTVEMGPMIMELKGADYDQVVVTGTLAFEDILNNAYPSGRYVPTDYPGLF